MKSEKENKTKLKNKEHNNREHRTDKYLFRDREYWIIFKLRRCE